MGLPLGYVFAAHIPQPCIGLCAFGKKPPNKTSTKIQPKPWSRRPGQKKGWRRGRRGGAALGRKLDGQHLWPKKILQTVEFGWFCLSNKTNGYLFLRPTWAPKGECVCRDGCDPPRQGMQSIHAAIGGKLRVKIMGAPPSKALVFATSRLFFNKLILP